MGENKADSAGRAGPGPQADAELAELREMMQAFTRKLRAYGALRAEELGVDLEEGGEALIQEGRRLAEEMRVRLGEVEAKVERSIRDHPTGWIGGILGAIGFGILLSLILHRRS